MKRSFAFLSLLFSSLLIMTVAAPAAVASPPTSASGTITVTGSTVTDTRMANGNTIVESTNTDEITGTISGTCLEHARDVVHKSGRINGHSWITCDATVEGRSGTLTFRVNGKGDAATGEFSGQWVITGGSGGLEGLHGQGTFEGVAPTFTYSGRVHFD